MNFIYDVFPEIQSHRWEKGCGFEDPLGEVTFRFRQQTVNIPFADFNYFYGQMALEKSSIARLIDFCFGGR